MNLWGILMYANNGMDGVTKHLLYVDRLLKLFRTRQSARDYINANFGYIKERHGWRMPTPIKVLRREK